MAIKVSQATIDAIKSKGMSASLKAASAGGASDEFKEGVKRMYGANRMGAQNEKTMNEADNAATASATTAAKPVEKAPVQMPASAPAAATRAVTPKKIDTGQTFGVAKKVGNWFTKGDKKASQEEAARTQARNASKPPPKPKTPAQVTSSRAKQLQGNISSYDSQSASAKRTQQYQSDVAELKKLTGK